MAERFNKDEATERAPQYRYMINLENKERRKAVRKQNQGGGKRVGKKGADGTFAQLEDGSSIVSYANDVLTFETVCADICSKGGAYDDVYDLEVLLKSSDSAAQLDIDAQIEVKGTPCGVMDEKFFCRTGGGSSATLLTAGAALKDADLKQLVSLRIAGAWSLPAQAVR